MRDKMKTWIAFGVGINFYSFIERLDPICPIAAFSDNDCYKWGQYLLGDSRICMNPEMLKTLSHPFVIITAERESSIQAIEKQCDEYGVPHQRIKDLFEGIKLQPVKCCWPQKIQRRRVHKFIELLVHGTTECNFHCEYCYVWRKNEFTPGKETSEHTPKEIRSALSLKKLGGPCHINICALGETLLSKDIVSLTYELLEEGHYLSIITNGTITPKIDEILRFPQGFLERMFFKLSFHYAELNRTRLSAVFWKNVEKIKNSPCSYSIEITPCDSLIQEIDRVKEEFEDKAGGAMPHITFTRDAEKEGLDLLSDLSLEEYKNTWSVFHSDLFALKCRLYKKKIEQFCYAGNWSYRINLVNGNLQSCYRQELRGTIFDREQKVLPLLTVGQSCRMDYCFNNHAFLAWGDVPELPCENYLKVRDRVSENGFHWVKDSYAAFMGQKLYDNNFAYRDRWSDYERLFEVGRRPAFILLNSPDYGNLGDHAIAYAERKLFERLFPDVALIEISCEQYIRENLLLQNVIQQEDILLVNGGGYLGSLWLWLEDMTKNIIEQYKDNQILIFPQTIYFEDSCLGETEKQSLSEVLNSHKNLTIMLRDRRSFQTAQELLKDSVRRLLVPDIVLSLSRKQNCMRTGSLVCLRQDKESKGFDSAAIEEILRQKGLEPEFFSTVSEDEIYLDNREIYLGQLWDKISRAELMVTDRLHAVIFCVITDTPCIALNNISGKVFELKHWLKNDSLVIFCEQTEQLENYVERIQNNRIEEITAKNDGLEMALKELEHYLKENCFL